MSPGPKGRILLGRYPGECLPGPRCASLPVLDAAKLFRVPAAQEGQEMFLGKARCRVVCVVRCHLGVLKTHVSMCVHPHTRAWVGCLRKEKNETLGDSALLQCPTSHQLGRAGRAILTFPPLKRHTETGGRKGKKGERKPKCDRMLIVEN